MRHAAVHRYGTNWQFNLKGQEAQIASNNVKNNCLTKMEYSGLLIYSESVGMK